MKKKPNFLERHFGRNKPDSEKPVGSRMLLENLEPRILYSAAPVDGGCTPDAELGSEPAHEAPLLASQSGQPSAESQIEAQEAFDAAPESVLDTEVYLLTDESEVFDAAPSVEGEAPMEVIGESLLEVDEWGQYSAEAPESDLNPDMVNWMAEAAAERWRMTGLTEEQSLALANVVYQVVDLPGNYLGSAENSIITIDLDAAGRTWFLDETPLDDEEYISASLGSTQMIADIDSAANDRVDLLSVLLHEQGHILGLSDVYGSSSQGIMYAFFETGERRLISDGQAEGAIAGSLEGVHYATLIGTWDGGGADGNWSTKENWDGDVVPLDDGSFHTFVFDGTANTTVTMDQAGAAAGWNADSLEFAAGAGAFTINGPAYFDMLGEGGDAASAVVVNNSTDTQTINTRLIHRTDQNTGLVFDADTGDIVVGGDISHVGSVVTDAVKIVGDHSVTFAGDNSYVQETTVGLVSISDDFESYSTGNAGADTVWNRNTTGRVAVASDSDGNFMTFGYDGGLNSTTIGASTAYRGIHRNLEDAAIGENSSGVVTFDARVTHDGGEWYYGVTERIDGRVEDVGNNGAQPRSLSDMRAYVGFVKDAAAGDDKVNLVAGDSGTGLVTLATGVDINEWHHIELLIDHTAKTYEVFVGGVQQGGTLNFDGATGDLDYFIAFGAGGSRSSSPFEGQLDNVWAGIVQDSPTLILDGTHTNAGDYFIGETSTLSGTGSTDGAVTIRGTLSPGNAASPVESLDVGALTFAPGSAFQVQIHGDGTMLAGAGNDVVNVSGDVDLGAGVATLDVASLAMVPTGAHAYTLINNTSGTTTGFFKDSLGNVIAEGGTVSVDGIDYDISYAGGDGNDVVLTYGQVFYVNPDFVAEEIVLDSEDHSGNAAITLTGSWAQSTSAPGYQGSSYLHDGNTDKGSKSVEFRPELLGGTYEVSIQWAARADRASTTPVTIVDMNGSHDRSVDQTTGGDLFLGEFEFSPGNAGKVTISNGANGYVIADGITFLRVPGSFATDVPDVDDEIAGEQPGTRFETIADALAAAATDEPLTLIVNQGDYSAEDLDLSSFTDSVIVKFIEGDSSIGSLTGGSNVTVELGGVDGVHNTPTTLTLSSGNFGGAIAGTGGITKTGSGTLAFSGDNSYQGDTLVDDGVLAISHSNALGSTAGGTTVNKANNARLDLSGSITVADAISFTGSGLNNALRNVSGDNVISGEVSLPGNIRVKSDGGSLTFTGGITGTNTFFVINASGGSIEFTTNPIDIGSSGQFYTDSNGLTVLGVDGNTWGTTFLKNGTLSLGVANALPTNATFRHFGSSGGTLNLNGFAQTIARLYTDATTPNDSGSQITSATAATLTIDQSTNTTYVGEINGSVSLVKDGTGTLTLSGTNTYLGTTDIEDGMLVVNGEIGNGGPADTLTIGTGATLAGSGVINAPIAGTSTTAAITATGTLSLGDGSSTGFSFNGTLDVAGEAVTILDSDAASVGDITISGGTLTVSNGLSMAGGDVLAGSGTVTGNVDVNLGEVEVGGSGATATLRINGDLVFDSTSGSNSGDLSLEVESGANDLVEVTGDVVLTNVSLSLATLSGFSSSHGSQLTLIDNQGTNAVSGTFAGLADGTRIDALSSGTIDAFISYFGGDGNDVTISFIDTNDSTPTTVQGPNGDTQFQVRIVESTVQVLQNNVVVDSRPLDAVDKLVINGDNGGTGNDTFTIDYSNAALLNVDIEVNGQGDNGGMGDQLVIENGSFASAVYTYTSENDGSILLNGTSTITYTGLEPIESINPTGDVTLEFTSSESEVITVTENVDNTLTIDSTAGESTTIAKPSGLLTILGASDDRVVISTDLDLTADVTFDIGRVDLDHNIRAGGVVTFDATVVVGGDVIVDTSASGSDVIFEGIVAGDAAGQSLSMNAGVGNVTFNGNVTGGISVVEGEDDSARTTTATDGTEWKVAPTGLDLNAEGTVLMSNARGGEYVQLLADGSGSAGGPTNDPTIEYDLTVTTPGTYQLYVRWDGEDGASDSFYADIVQLKDGVGGIHPDHYEFQHGTDHNFATTPWDGEGGFEVNNSGGTPKQDATWEITQQDIDDHGGTFTVRFSEREDGVAIDAFVFQLASLAAPTGTGPAAIKNLSRLGTLSINANAADFNALLDVETLDVDTGVVTAHDTVLVKDVVLSETGTTATFALEDAATGTIFNAVTDNGGDSVLNIDDGTLTVANGLMVDEIRVGYSGTGALTVTGGAVNIGDSAGNFRIGYSNSGSSAVGSGSVDFSNADSVTVDVSNVHIGVNSYSSGSGTVGSLTLSSSGDNEITADRILIADSNPPGNSGVVSKLILGSTTNTLNVNTFDVGYRKASGSVTIADDGILILNGKGGAGTDADLYVGYNNASGTGTDNEGVFDMTGGTIINATIDLLAVGRYRGSGSGSGNGTFTMDAGMVSAKTIQLANADSGTNPGETDGIFNLNGGTLQFGTLSELGGTYEFNWASGAIIQNLSGQDLDNTNVLMNLTGVGVHRLTVDAGQVATFAAASSITDTDGDSDDATLDKDGTGTLIFEGNATFGGGTNIDEGTLAGTGTFAGTVTVDAGALIGPGLSPGVLNTGDLDIDGIYEVELTGTGAGQVDQVNVNGLVDVSSGTLQITTPGFDPQPGDTFVIVVNDDADATGFFTNANGDDTLVTSLDGLNQFSVSYNYDAASGTEGSGNDIALTVVNRAPVGTVDNASTDEDTVLVSGVISPTIQALNPLAYYRFNDAAGSGTVQDSAGTVNDAATVGSAVTLGVAGQNTGLFETTNTAADFDKSASVSNNHIVIPGTLEGTQMTSASGTVSFYFNASAADDSGTSHLFWAGSAGGDGFGGENEMHVNLRADGELQMYIQGASSVNAFTSGTDYRDGQWHQIIFSWDKTANEVKLHVDGAEELSSQHTGNTFNLNNIRLGSPTNNNGDRDFGGLIDEAAFWDTALSTPDVAKLTDPKGILTNDSDPDGDSISIVPWTTVSANGAAVTVDVNGGFTYDPTASAELQSLLPGQTVTDTFTYFVSDGNQPGDAAVMFDANDLGTTSNMSGQGGGTGLSGSWGGGTGTIRVVGMDLTYPGYNVTQEGNSRAVQGDYTQFKNLNRALTTPLDGEVWFSYLVQNPVGEDAKGGLAFNLTDSTDYDAATFQVVANGTGLQIRLPNGTGTTDVTVPNQFTDGQTSLVVGRLNIGAGANDTIEVWVDPDPVNGTTQGPAYSGTGDFGDSISRLGIVSYATNAEWSSSSPAEGGIVDAIRMDNSAYAVIGAASAEVTVTVEGRNDAPDAVDDTYTTSEDTVLDVDVASGVLNNDTDVDNDTLQVQAFDATSDKGAVVSMNANGSFSYDPTGSAELQGLLPGQTVNDTFTYTNSDGNGGTDTATVTITVQGADDGPAISADSVLTFTEGEGPTVVHPTLSLTDPDTNDIADGDARSNLDTSNFVAIAAIGTGFVDGQDQLALDTGSISSNLNVSVSADKSFVTITADNSSSTLADFEDALRKVTFENTSDNPTISNREIVFGFFDGDQITDPTTSQTIANWDFEDGNADFSPDVTATGFTISDITKGNVLYFATDYKGDYPSKVLGVSPADTNSPTLAQAVANNTYVEFTISSNGAAYNLSRLAFEVSKGGSGTRGISIRFSDDDFSSYTEVVSQDITTSRHAQTPFDVDLSTYDALKNLNGDLKARIYVYAPGNGNRLEFDNFSLTGEVGHSVVVDTSIVPVNDPPNPVDDSFDADEDTVLEIDVTDGVLDNDTDPENDSLQVVGFDASSVKGATVVVDSDGSFSYDPTGVAEFQGLLPGQSVEDTFTYTVSDGNGETGTATVTITVQGADDAATIASDATLSFTENDGPTAIHPGLTLTDPDTNDLADGDSRASLDSSNYVASATITSGFVPGEDQLYLDVNEISSNLSVSFSADHIEIAASNSNATLADFQDALRKITFENVSENPTTSPNREVSFRFFDGDLATNPGTSLTLASWDFQDGNADFAPDVEGDGFTISDISKGNVLYFATDYQGSYPSKVLGVSPADSNSPTLADAVENDTYVEFSISSGATPYNLTQLQFEVSKGGSGTRGISIRFSDDDFSSYTEVVSQDITTSRHAQTPFDVDLSTYGALKNLSGDLEARIYVYAPGNGNRLEFDNLTLSGEVSGGVVVDTAVVAVNDLPVAADDTAQAKERGASPGSKATGNVLTNDSDVDDAAGEFGVVRFGSGDEVAGATTDAGGSVAGNYGTLQLNADGAYTYTVDDSNSTVDGLLSGETLTDTFIYNVQDGDSQDATAPAPGDAEPSVAVDFSDVSGGFKGKSFGDGITGSWDGSSNVYSKTGGLSSSLYNVTQSDNVSATGHDTNHRQVVADLETAMQGEVWFSFLVRNNSSSAVSGITLNPNNPSSGPVYDPDYDFGILASGSKLAVNGNETDNVFDTTGSVTHLVVGRLNLEVGTESLDIWVDPNLTGDPVLPTATWSGSASALAQEIASLGIVAYGNGNLDNILLGESQHDVTGVADPATLQPANYATLTVTITGTNDAPVANADTNFAVEHGATANGEQIAGGGGSTPGTASGNVLIDTDYGDGFADAADTDADDALDGTNVAVTQIRYSGEGTPRGSNAGGDVSGATVVDGQYGYLTISPNGSYTYTIDQAVADELAGDESITETFTYTIEDGGEDEVEVSAIIGLELDGNNQLANITVENASGDSFVLTSGDLVGVQVTQFRGENASVLFTEGGATGVPAQGDRALALEDDAFDTGLANPKYATASELEAGTNVGMTVEFDRSVNSALFFEVGDGDPIVAQVSLDGVNWSDAVSFASGDYWWDNVSSVAVEVFEMGSVPNTLNDVENGTFTKTPYGTTVAVRGLALTADRFGVESFRYLRYSSGVANAVDPVYIAGVQSASDSDTLTITVQGNNDAPVANDDTNIAVEAGGVENGILGINPSGNVIGSLGGGSGASAGDVPDTDADLKVREKLYVTNVTFSGAPFSGATYFGGAVAVDGSVRVDGAYGSLEIWSDGSYTYTVDETVADQLDAGDAPVEEFVYTVSDQPGLTETTLTTYAFQGNGSPSSPHAAIDAGSVSVSSTANTGDTFISGSTYTALIRGDGTASDQASALTDDDYFEFTITPNPGETISLTALEFEHFANNAGTVTSGTSSRVHWSSSLDNFQTALHDADAFVQPFQDVGDVNAVTRETSVLNLGSEFQNLTGPVTFRFTFSDDSIDNEFINRLDNLVVRGIVGEVSTDTGNLAIEVRGTNDIPVAVSDTSIAVEAGIRTGFTGTGNVLSNDSDIDTDDVGNLSVVAFGSGSDSGDATTAAGDTATGNFGSIQIGANGSFTYTVDDANAAVQALDSGDTLTDTFVYKVQDTTTANPSVKVDFSSLSDGASIGTTHGQGLNGAWGGTSTINAVSDGLVSELYNIPPSDKAAEGDYGGPRQVVANLQEPMASEVWFSFLVQNVDDQNDDGVGGITFNSKANDANGILNYEPENDFGVFASGGDLVVGVTEGSFEVREGLFTPGQTHLVVGRLNLVDGVETIDVWVDPNLTDNPELPEANYSGALHGTAIAAQQEITSLGIAAYRDSLLDNILLGGEMLDVTGINSQFATLTVTIQGANDAPQIVDDENFAVEPGGENNQTVVVGGDGETSSGTKGNVMGGDGVSPNDGADLDVDGDDDPAAGNGSVVVTQAEYTGSGTPVGSNAGGRVNGATVVDGAYGQLTINPDGSYSYTVDPGASDSLNSGDTADEEFTYTIANTEELARFDLNPSSSTQNIAPDSEAADLVSVSLQAKGSSGEIFVSGSSKTALIRASAAPGSEDAALDNLLDGTGTNYFEFIVTPAIGESVTLTSIEFEAGISNGTFDSHLYFQSSVGDFGSSNPVLGSFNPTTRNDSFINYPAYELELGDEFRDVSSPVTFRFTWSDNSGVSGYISRLDNLVINGYQAGAEDTGILTIEVQGRNDDPVAANDSGATDEDTKLTVSVAEGLLANDSDADAGDVVGTNVLVSDFDPLSQYGAAVSVDPDGGFSYDPRESAYLQTLAEGETIVDTFTYTISDDESATHTATVSITVSGKGAIEIETDKVFPPGFGGDPASFSPDTASIVMNCGNLEISVNGTLLRSIANSVLTNGAGVDNDSGDANPDGKHDIVFRGAGDSVTLTAGTLDSGVFNDLEVVSADRVDFTAASSLAGRLTVNAGSINLGANLMTGGEQEFNGPVTLTANVSLTAVDTDSDGEGVDFANTVAGSGNNLTLSGGAGVAEAISGVGVLRADRIDSESTISAASVDVTGVSELGGNVATSGAQTYGGAITLTDHVSLIGGTLSTQAIGGAFDLTTVSTGVTTFASALNLGGLNVTSGASLDIGVDITTTGDQILTTAGNFTLLSTAALDAGVGSITVYADHSNSTTPEADGVFVNWLGTVNAAAVTIYGGTAEDAFRVQPSETTEITVHGLDPTTLPGDALVVLGPDPQLNSTGSGEGNYTFPAANPALLPVHFTSIESDNLVPVLLGVSIRDSLVHGVGQGPIALFPNIQVTQANLVISATIQIHGGYQPDEDRLSAIALPAGLSQRFDRSSGTLTISAGPGGVSSKAMEQALRAVAYSNKDVSDPAAGTRWFVVEVQDGTDRSNALQVSVIQEGKTKPASAAGTNTGDTPATATGTTPAGEESAAGELSNLQSLLNSFGDSGVFAGVRLDEVLDGSSGYQFLNGQLITPEGVVIDPSTIRSGESSVLPTLPPAFSLTPFFAGTSAVGAQIVVTISDGAGGFSYTTTVQADAAGNWSASLSGVTLEDRVYSITIQEVSPIFAMEGGSSSIFRAGSFRGGLIPGLSTEEELTLGDIYGLIIDATNPEDAILQLEQ